MNTGQVRDAEPITNVADLLQYIDNFYLTSQSECCVQVSSKLRKQLPKIKEHANKTNTSLNYLALGSGEVYKLIIAKNPIQISFSDLSAKGKSIAQKFKTHSLEEKQRAVECILRLGCEKDWINKHWHLIGQVVKHIKSLGKFKEWKNSPSISIDEQANKYGSNLYVDRNDGKMFVALDLISANFQVFQLANIIEEDSWSEFMSRFIRDDYFQNLKSLRLHCLGDKSLNPMKQKQDWERIILNVLKDILDIVAPEEIAIVNSDEIVVAVDQIEVFEKIQKLLVQKYSQYRIRTSWFVLKKLTPSHMWVKEMMDNTMKKIDVEFKCCAAHQLDEAKKIYVDLGRGVKCGEK